MRLRVRRDDAAAAREAGFTMAEMVVTVTIVAVLFLAVSMLLESSLKALSAAKARARANDLATAGIEDLQRYSFNNLGMCPAAPTPVPAGMDTGVELVNCPAGDPNETNAMFEDPCNEAVGTVPRKKYTCTRNNVEYTVKRYVAWADELKSTKRLAVYVEWTDLVGNHQVSQQSSLRAPDQSAILGLAPPKFTAVPTVKRFNNGVETPSQPVLVTASHEVASPWSIQLSAITTTLDGPATTTLTGVGIPVHAQGATLTITVANGSLFPGYNGFSVTIDNETFKVISGAGTNTWRVTAGGTSAHGAGATQVLFGGDRVYAVVQTIGSNNHPESSTVLMSTLNGTSWNAEISHSTSEYLFGPGAQYVSFGILRAADGKTSSAFAGQLLDFCPSSDPSCSTIARPVMDNATVTPSTVTLGASGSLQGDVTVRVRTTNITRQDTVTVSFLTQFGTQTVVLASDSTTTCPLTATTPGFSCNWVGTIPKTAGYRFTPGSQPFYFGAQQVLDVDPTSVDQASMGVVVYPTVTFAS